MIDIAQNPDDPRGYRLTAEQLLPAGLAEVFAFFSDAHNLQEITPPWMHFSVVTPSPIELRAGTLIDYRLRVHGVPLRWQSQISVWEPPHRFVDEQLRGPYRRWHHTHTFVEENGHTLVRDVVDYAVPGGGLVHALLVKPDLQKIFAYRQQVLEQRFGKVDTDPAVA